MDTDSARRQFEAVVNSHGAAIYRYAYWICGDRSMAEDLVQETFTRAWRFRDALRDKRKVKAWLTTTLRREYARQFERYRPEIMDVDPESIADASAAGGHTPQSWELRRMIVALPEKFREPLLLQVIFGYSGLEIAHIMGIPRGTVNTRLNRARQRLIDAVSDDVGLSERLSPHGAGTCAAR